MAVLHHCGVSVVHSATHCAGPVYDYIRRLNACSSPNTSSTSHQPRGVCMLHARNWETPRLAETGKVQVWAGVVVRLWTARKMKWQKIACCRPNPKPLERTPRQTFAFRADKRLEPHDFWTVFSCLLLRKYYIAKANITIKHPISQLTSVPWCVNWTVTKPFPSSVWIVLVVGCSIASHYSQ